MFKFKAIFSNLLLKTDFEKVIVESLPYLFFHRVSMSCYQIPPLTSPKRRFPQVFLLKLSIKIYIIYRDYSHTHQ